MNIYTSYFNNLKTIPSYITPIAICLYPPNSYRGLRYRKLTPSRKSLKFLKDGIIKESGFTLQYYNERLSKLTIMEVYSDLVSLSGNSDSVVLLCHESKDKFCHRHLVTEWFKSNKIDIKEW